jgi:mutual gliding-motility protein MglA
MARIDLARRRMELKLVYWGPALGGKTTTLQSLHGVCRAGDRGELTSIETEGERTYFFDYAPLDLPRFRGLELRTHAYTVPGQDMYVRTRQRIVQGASVVIFVADARPSAREATLSSWRQLDAALVGLEAGSPPLPVVVAANKCDLPEADSADDVRRHLEAACPTRRLTSVHATSALTGRGVVRCFRDAVIGGVERALGATGAPSAEERVQFLATLAERMRGADDGLPAAQAPERRRVQVDSNGIATQDAALKTALATTALLAERDLVVQSMHRATAFGKVLLEVGQLCMSAARVEPLARSVLSTLMMNLDAVGGWLGLPCGPAEQQVFDARGVCADAGPVARVARARLASQAADVPIVVGPDDADALPVGGAAGAGLLLPFRAGPDGRGWILLVGSRAGGLPPDAAPVVATTGGFVALALARIAAHEALRVANADLEARVASRTRELEEEKSKLEVRVRERTSELEAAKRATVEAERRLIDRERAESVNRLAAGLAHEINNPLGAVRANLEFLRDGLVGGPAPAGPPATDADDLRSAVDDCLADVERVVQSVRSLFGDAAASRRSAHRTALAAVVRDTAVAYVRTHPQAQAPRISEGDNVFVGLPPGECERWIYRLLTLASPAGDRSLRIDVDVGPGGPQVTVEVGGAMPGDPLADLRTAGHELERIGAHLEVRGGPDRTLLCLTLPRATGEADDARRLARGPGPVHR